jgi:chemotaxis protein CheZ
MPLVESLHQRSLELTARWTRFRKRELSVEEFRVFAQELDQFFVESGEEADRIRTLMSEIMMAQDFQDLTGQIIRRVIRLVQEVEENLVGLIRLSSSRMEPPKALPREEEEAEHLAASKSFGPIVPNTHDAAAEVVSGQDDVDALLSSLGF